MTHRSTRIGLLLAVATAILSAAVTASAQSDAAVDKARDHYQRGRQAFDAGDYQGAIREFTTADRLAPSPILEYNIGLCHEQLGDKAQAVKHFRSYLERMPNAQNRAAVSARIRELEAELSAQSQPVQPTPPPLTEERSEAPADQPSKDGPEVPAETGTGQSNTDPGGSAGTASAPTGDAELDRVAAIDPSAVRDQRYGATAAPQPAQGGPVQPGPADKPSEARPFYKQWWFWVVAGVGAIVLIDIATSDSDDDGSRALFPIDNSRATPSSGAVLWRF